MREIVVPSCMSSGRLQKKQFYYRNVCISFIRTLGTHNKQIIKSHHITHTHSISADISFIVKSRTCSMLAA